MDAQIVGEILEYWKWAFSRSKCVFSPILLNWWEVRQNPITLPFGKLISNLKSFL